jgi:hypothetical protein
MSLINDALKKADEAQRTGGAPAPPPIPMRPAKPSTSSLLPVVLLIGFMLAVLGLAAWFFAGWWKMNREHLLAKTAEVHARPAPAVVEINEPAAPVPPPPAIEIKEPIVETNIVTVTNFVQAKLEAPSLTNIVKTLTALRLQGVFYRPPESSALINGKSLHVGEKFQDISVLEIRKDRVTVSLNGVTNVLEMK